MPVFAGEPFDPAVPDDLVGGNDVGGDLRDIGGVLPDSGHDNPNCFANAAEQGLACIVLRFVGLAVAKWSLKRSVAKSASSFTMTWDVGVLRHEACLQSVWDLTLTTARTPPRPPSGQAGSR